MPSKTSARFSDPRHQAVAAFLRNACDTGELGTGPKESDSVHRRLALKLARTFPWLTLTIQLLWSGAVVCGGYFISARRVAQSSEGAGAPSTLSSDFWQSRLNVSSTVAYGVGWALFVLLSLYIREASQRYEGAQIAVQRACAALKRVVRVVRQGYPRGTWHAGDHDRILAHLVAQPVALKMTLRRERDSSQLLPLLHRTDVDDVLAADVVHLQCTRVVRAYLTAAEDDAKAFKLTRADSTPPGADARRHASQLLDSVDTAAHDAVQIAHFRPAAAYINHLRVFLYIWMMFLPLALLGESGWYVIPPSFLALNCLDFISFTFCLPDSFTSIFFTFCSFLKKRIHPCVSTFFFFFCKYTYHQYLTFLLLTCIFFLLRTPFPPSC